MVTQYQPSPTALNTPARREIDLENFSDDDAVAQIEADLGIQDQVDDTHGSVIAEGASDNRSERDFDAWMEEANSSDATLDTFEDALYEEDLDLLNPQPQDGEGQGPPPPPGGGGGLGGGGLPNPGLSLKGIGDIVGKFKNVADAKMNEKKKEEENKDRDTGDTGDTGGGYDREPAGEDRTDGEDKAGSESPRNPVLEFRNDIVSNFRVKADDKKGGEEQVVEVIETDGNGEERAREMRLDELLGPRAPDPRPPAINLDDLQQQEPNFEIKREGEEEPPKGGIGDKLSGILNLGNKPDPDVNKGAVDTSVGGNPAMKQKGLIFRRGRGKKGMGRR